MKTTNKKRSFLSVCLIGFLFTLGTGLNVHAQSESRDVGSFSSVNLSLPVSLEIVQGNATSLVIEGDKEDIAQIVTETKGDKLRIYCNKNNYRFGTVTIKLTVVDLNNISLAGSGDIVVKSPLKTDELGIHVSGSGDVEALSLTADKVEAHLAGSGNIDLAGDATKSLSIHIAGSGDVKAEGLESNDVTVNIAGSGSAKVNAKENLETNIVGSGSVYYKGKPLVNSKTTGSGKTRPL